MHWYAVDPHPRQTRASSNGGNAQIEASASQPLNIVADEDHTYSETVTFKETVLSFFEGQACVLKTSWWKIYRPFIHCGFGFQGMGSHD